MIHVKKQHNKELWHIIEMLCCPLS